MQLEANFFQGKTTKTLLDEISSILITRDLMLNDNKDLDHKKKRSSRYFSPGPDPSRRCSKIQYTFKSNADESNKIPMPKYKEIMRVKHNLKIVLQNPKKKLENLNSSPRLTTKSALLPLSPKSFLGSGSGSSIIMEEENEINKRSPSQGIFNQGRAEQMKK